MKEIRFKEKARQGLKRGVDLIADAVKATLGPRGRNVIYGFHYGFPKATKDGVTVARQVESSDQLEQLGVLLVREVAQKTADDSGDGTTTASVLAQAIFTEGLKSLNTGANPILIKRGIDKATEEVIQFIEEHSQSIEGDEAILNVSTLSANNDSAIGELVASAISQVGDNGVVTIEDNYGSSQSEIQKVEGMQLNEGMIHPFFVTDPDRLIAEYNNPKILLIDGTLENIMPYAKVIEQVLAGENKSPLLIIAHSVTGVALQTLTGSKIQKGLELLACKAPQFGDYRRDMLSDIAVATGATIVGGEVGIRAVDLNYSQLGTCSHVRADRFTTTLIGGGGDVAEISSRIKLLEGQIEESKSDYDKEKLQERLAKLTTGVAVVRVGAHSEVEQQEIKMRVEDSLHATRAAIEEGVVPGGGAVYLKASEALEVPSESLEEERIGYGIIKKSLRTPLLQIAENSGVSGEQIIAKILSNGKDIANGYNFLTNNYVNLIDDGIIDPTKVVKNALKNAASVAGTLLTTEVAIYEREEDVVPPTRTPKPRSE